MPLDFRRFNGPDDSVSYKRYVKNDLKTYDDLRSELLNENDTRSDGRQLNEARTTSMFFARTGMVSQAKGSSYVELKKTKVVCSVFDPREIPHQNEFSLQGQLFCEVKFAPFSCPRKRRPHVPDTEEKALSVALRQALEPAVCRHLFPNYQIDIFVYVLEHGGACLSAAVNAAGLALADAAVPMSDIITSCSAAVIENKIFIDPTEAEEFLAMTSPETDNVAHGIVTMSMLPGMKQITDFQQMGSIEINNIERIMDMLEQECKKIEPHIQRVLVVDVIKNCDQKKQLEEESRKREEVLNKMMEEWKGLLNGG